MNTNIELKSLLPISAISLLMFSFLLIGTVNAQKHLIPKSKIGIGTFYNFQTESQAIELRFKKNLTKNIAVTPRISYFFPGNKIHEYYAGLDASYQMNIKRKVQPYIFAGAYYNNWINYEQYGASIRKKNNVPVEVGCGVEFNLWCRIKPYLEWRYDTKWKEGSLGAGLFISFGKCPGRGLASKCPAYH